LGIDLITPERLGEAPNPSYSRLKSPKNFLPLGLSSIRRSSKGRRTNPGILTALWTLVSCYKSELGRVPDWISLTAGIYDCPGILGNTDRGKTGVITIKNQKHIRGATRRLIFWGGKWEVEEPAVEIFRTITHLEGELSIRGGKNRL